MISTPGAVCNVPSLALGACLDWSDEKNSAASRESSGVRLVIDSSSVSCSNSSFCSEISSTSPDCLSERSTSSEPVSLSLLSEFCQRDSHQCTTSDGWRLHITHAYDPTAETCSSSLRPQHPVLMVPGLASSGEHTFDLLPDYSLVNTLVARGYDVWVADLRGNGQSQKPNLLDSSTWWTVDDHFLQDVPAVLEYVLSATGAKQVHWVGHSMGGMLAVGLISQKPELAAALRSVTLLASGCFGSGSWHSWLKPVINGITRYGFPAGLVCWAIGALSGATKALWPIEALFYWPCNMPQAAAKKLMKSCFRFIPVGVIKQFMGSLNTEQGLSAADGSFLYADPQQLKEADVPVLALNGTWDLFCPAAGGQKTLELFGSRHKQFVCLGPSQRTGQRHYGHFDIVSGKDAPREVHPYITSWLEQHDAPQPL